MRFAPGCTLPLDVVGCMAYAYSVNAGVGGQLSAILNPGAGQTVLSFGPPGVLVSHTTHVAIVNALDAGDPSAPVLQALYVHVADATREMCRRRVQDHLDTLPGQQNVMGEMTNCEGYDEAFAQSQLAPGQMVPESDPDPAGAHIQVDPQCFGIDLLGENLSPFGDTDGVDSPDHPMSRVVSCQCEVEKVGPCAPSGLYAPDRDGAAGTPPRTTHEKFCLPEGRMPADFCRVDVANYLNGAVRMIGGYQGAEVSDPDPDFCSGYDPSLIDVVVRCAPEDMDDLDPADVGTQAYTDQEDLCFEGCGNLDCHDADFWVTECDFQEAAQGPADCDVDGCTVGPGCDCDTLPPGCLEAPVTDGVCIPEAGGGGDGGGDGADDTAGGGGGQARLKSAVSLLQGAWDDSGLCTSLQPGSGNLVHNPAGAVTSGLDTAPLDNGTTFDGIQLGCANPGTDDIGLASLGMSLEELCEAIPVCAYSSDLDLSLAAKVGTTTVATGTLDKVAGVVTTTDSGTALSAGTYTVDLCLTDDTTGGEVCVAQPIKVSSPLGSGTDTFGHFAAEMAGGFVELTGKLGAEVLAVGDDGSAPVSLPSGFTFDFYNEGPVSVLTVGANGGINIGTTGIGSTNTSLPAPGGVLAPNIAVYWDDLDPSAGGNVLTWYDGQRFIVSWEHVPHGNGSGASFGEVSVQAHLYADGRIEFHYADTDVGASAYNFGRSATIGISNTARTDVVQVSFNNNSLLGSGVESVGMFGGNCVGDELVLDPIIGCSARDHAATVCTSSGSAVAVPTPDISTCAPLSTTLEASVIESGKTEAGLRPLRTPIPVVSGSATLGTGVYKVEYRVVDPSGDELAPRFYRLVFVTQWVHHECGGSLRSLAQLTDSDDVFDTSTDPTSMAVIGQDGYDFIEVGSGSDFLHGGWQGGVCEAREGVDYLVGVAASETLDAGDGDDFVWGDGGDDLVQGGAGNDELHGGPGSDICEGADGDDVIWGDADDDILDGGDGDDVLFPGSGIDIVLGGEGDDQIVLLDPCELTFGKTLYGGAGDDTLMLPPELSLADVTAAGVVVAADLENAVNWVDVPSHESDCE
jgi:Ca2+-binding RTX toxin-like protein